MTTPTTPAIETGKANFQQRVHEWMKACFGPETGTRPGDKQERSHRFLEEALELVQACGCTEDEARQLVAYVFNRPVGEMAQEAGGTMTTLAALCNIHGLDMLAVAETELARNWQNIEKIRAKQAGKPKCSPLPQSVEPKTCSPAIEELMAKDETEYPPLNVGCGLTLNATREDLGREVRRVWIECCKEAGVSKPSYLAEWDDMPEYDREVDRRIGEAVAKLTMTNLSDDEPVPLPAIAARLNDACPECKGSGEIGYMTQTDYGPEGDSSVCHVCAGSGSYRVSQVIESWGDGEQIDRLSEALKWAVEFIRCNVPTHTDYPDFHNAYDLTRDDSIMGIFTETRHRNESLTEQVAALSLELEAAEAKAKGLAKAVFNESTVAATTEWQKPLDRAGAVILRILFQSGYIQRHPTENWYRWLPQEAETKEGKG